MRFTLTGLCAVGLVMGAPLAASAISLTDYKFPESTSQSAYLSGNFTSTDATGQNQVVYNLGATGTYDFNHRSLPFSWLFHAEAEGNAIRADSTDTKGSYDVLARTRANKYFNETSDVFGYGRTTAEFRALTPGDPPDELYWDGAVGAGIGRTIDATVLKQAVRIQEDFQKYGIITSDIPDAALLELAGIVDRRDEYVSRYGSVEFEKYWYEDMAEVLRRSNVIKEANLPAMGIIRIREILERERTGRRFYGWEARAGVGMVISNFTNQNEDPFVEAALDWARPVGFDLQFTNNASLTGQLSSDPVYRLEDAFRAYYEISNRIDWDNLLMARYDVYTQSGAPEVTTLGLTSAFFFYLENQLDFSPSFSYNRVDAGVGDPAWNWTLRFNVLYRLR